MASVRMSRDLRHTILSNAREAFRKTNPEPELTTDEIDWLTNKVACSPWQTKAQEAYELLYDFPKVPGHYYNASMLMFGMPKIKSKAITRMVLKYASNNGSTRNIEFQLNTPRTMFVGNDHDTLNITTLCFEGDSRIEADRICQAYETRYDNHRKAKSDYDTQISQLLDNCTTLKQFLSAWPAGESFVPSNKIAELHTKVTRVQKAQRIKEEVNFDDTAVNKVVLTSKLMGN